MSGYLIKPLLFACAPFFYYPWKGVLNAVFGDGYQHAFTHFKQGHRGTTNLALHVVCLGIQLTGNFGLLRVIDDQYVSQPIPGVRIVSALSAIAWTLQLAPAPTPVACTLGAVGCIATAYFQSARIPSFQQYDNLAFGIYAGVYLGANFLLSKKKISAKLLIRSFAILGALYFGGMYLQSNYAGTQAVHTQNIQLALVLLLSLISLMRKPVAKVVVAGTLLARVGAILTGDVALYYLSFGFIGSLLQGISHQSTGEEGTLLALEKGEEGTELAFELAHVTFFPSILLHTLYEKIVGKKKL